MIQLFSSIIKNFMDTIVPKKETCHSRRNAYNKRVFESVKTEQDVIC